ncbi:hypothetical protein RAS12_26075 [Achromobacter seleniivolatilans]|uniref:Uncharacterized protein n=1 Tax=Achromobacter seleniivolatilans TaxID=3047478 RepID=A0ABY9M2G5_9BURK|nr:hypothetical protein [Achromobacter sp. R39]WMD20042.1 hypothetical protein RAS12_26075 [Achromobacter sp. R39]
MPKLLLRVCDFLLLALAAAVFGACLTSVLTTGEYGWAIPDAPYMYEPRDFYADAVLAGVAGLLVLVLAERVPRVRGSAPLRAVATLAAALLALYTAPPAPLVFGNTWARGEATRELFLAQMHMVLPIAFAVLVLRMGLWHFASRKKP